MLLFFPESIREARTIKDKHLEFERISFWSLKMQLKIGK